MRLLPPFPKSAGTIREFNEWNDTLKQKYPIRFAVMTRYDKIRRKVGYRIDNIKYWCLYRFHPRYQYNTINIVSLPRTYHDAQTIMLHGMFDVFCKFMDRIYDGNSAVIWEYNDIPDDQLTDEQRKSNRDWLEMQELYHWWMIQRPNREDRYLEDNPHVDLPDEWGILAAFDDRYREEDVMKEYLKQGRRLYDQQEQWNTIDQEMSIRLMKIRHLLWD